MINLSVLDFGSINPPEYMPREAIADLLELVVQAEGLGYKRYWLAEHFTPDCAWSFPESLITLMAGYTENIKIGIAGILLNYHNPFQVASTFKLLSFLYPGRIDLGIARGGIPPNILKALKITQPADQLHTTSQMKELVDILHGHNEINFPDYGAAPPDVWQLCSSPGAGLEMAIQYGSNLCVSLIHQGANTEKAKKVIDAFRQQTSNATNKRDCCVALNVFCSNDEVAVKNKIAEGKSNPSLANLIAGNKEFVREQIVLLQQYLEVTEFVIYIPAYSYEERLETLQNLSDLFLGHLISRSI